VTTTEEIQELAEQQLENRAGVRKALKTLHELLDEGETVLNLGSGVYEGKRGLVVVTEQRVIFYDRSFGSSRQEDFRFSKISSVESVGGMLGNGKLTIVASGNQALIHTVYPREYAEEVGDYVRSRLAADSPAVAAQGAGSAATDADPAERLRRLKSMLDEGLISAEEYEEKRSAILGEL
jgi:Bacterial PH domain/Short C-terminal domain